MITMNRYTNIKVINKIVAIIFVLAIILPIFLSTSIGYVGVGEVAVVIDPFSGGIVYTVEGPRYFIKMPWQNYDVIYTAISACYMYTHYKFGEKGEYPAINALTKDGLGVNVDVTLRWRIDPSKVSILYTNYPGKDWVDRTLAPRLRKIVRDVISNYTAIETISKRSEIARKINEKYMKLISVEKSLGGAIIVLGVELRNINLPAKFKEAIEEKLTQQQLMIAAEYRRNRTLIIANASAEASIIIASGNAMAKIILANATRMSIDIIKNVVGENPRLLENYLTFLMLKEIARSGKNVYIIIGNITGQRP